MDRQTPRYTVKQARDDSWDVIDTHRVRVVANRCDPDFAQREADRLNRREPDPTHFNRKQGG